MSSSGGGEPRTVDVRLTAPLPSQSYSLPPGVTFDVEAVYIEVDTTGAGGAVTAELTISEQSGVVIAKKTQGATIPAGSSGTATWALRLTDEAAGGGTTDPLAVHFDTTPSSGNFLDVETTAAGGQRFTAFGNTNINLTVHDFGTGQVAITTDAGEVFLASVALVNRLHPAGGAFEVQDHVADRLVYIDEQGDFQFYLRSGLAFRVLDHNGAEIMRVKDNGAGAPTYQIKTGAAWVANL